MVTAMCGVLLSACGGDPGGDDGWDVMVRPGPGATVIGGVPGPGATLVVGVPGEQAGPRITVAAAADLREVFTVLEPRIEAACQTDLVMVYGSSGQLRTQVLSGANFGLFLSADTAYATDVAAAGLAAPGGLASYAVGRLALAWRSGFPPLSTVSDLGRPDIKSVAIANPDHAPYGRAAKQVLGRSGIEAAVRERLVIGENIRQATDYVQKGNADAGLVALALVIGSTTPYVLVDPSLHDPIVQTGVVVKGTGAELTGRCVLQFLLDAEGQEALRQYGFEAVPP